MTKCLKRSLFLKIILSSSLCFFRVSQVEIMLSLVELMYSFQHKVGPTRAIFWQEGPLKESEILSKDYPILL